MLEMLFERRSDGTPVARTPTRHDGSKRIADGVNCFTIAQASEAFHMSEEELRSLYDDTFRDLYADQPTAAIEEAPAPRAFDAARVSSVRTDLMRAHRFGHLSDEQFAVVLEIGRVRGLDPWRHLWAEVKADGQRGKPELWVMTTIDAFVTIASRTGKYRGTTTAEYLDEDGAWHPDVWPEGKGTPVAARIGVRHADFVEPQYEVARWSRYVAYVDTPRGREVSDAWVRGGPEQLAKCALALAFRRAFGEELGNIYVREEMAQANNPRERVPAPPAARLPSGGGGPVGDPDPDDVVIDDTTPETWEEFENALERYGFNTAEKQKAVVIKLNRQIPFSPRSKTFWAAALRRLDTRPELYGAVLATA